MLIIPFQLFLDDKPSKLPSFMDKEHLGVEKKTLRNAINGKHRLSKRSIEIISNRAASFYSGVPGCSFDKSAFERALLEMDVEGISAAIKDDFTQYTRETVFQILEKDSEFSKYIQTEENHSSLDHEKIFEKIVTLNLPKGMLDEQIVPKQIVSLNDIFILLNRLRVDTVLYLSAAYEVEYNFHFFSSVNGNKSLVAKYLPALKENSFVNSIALWLDRLMEIHDIESINQFAKLIPQITKRPKEMDPDSQIRMMRKWRNGLLPNWSTIDSLTGALIKKSFPEMNLEDREHIKEQGRFFYSYIKIFQKLLEMMLPPEKVLGFDEEGVIDFFERYYLWHNYHSVQFTSERELTAIG